MRNSCKDFNEEWIHDTSFGCIRWNVYVEEYGFHRQIVGQFSSRKSAFDKLDEWELKYPKYYFTVEVIQ